MSNALLTPEMAKSARATLAERLYELQRGKRAMERRAGDALLLSRNLSHENARQSKRHLIITAEWMAQKRRIEVEISLAEMQLAYFKNMPLRVCDHVISEFVPPWVVWHMPEQRVFDLARDCVALTRHIPRENVQERIAEAHEHIVRNVSVFDTKQHKPPATITQAEREHLKILKEKLRRSAGIL